MQSDSEGAVLASLRKICRGIAGFFSDMQTVNREKATELLEYECMEMEHIFTLLLFGSFTGMPSPPVFISLELMPLMQDELMVMFDRVHVSRDALSDLFAVLGDH